MQAELVAAAIGADLQHAARRHGERRPAAVVGGVAYGTSVLSASLPPLRYSTTRLRARAALRERELG